MRSLTAGLLFLPLFLALPSAQAQIYTCKDASGRTITSDQPIPECFDRKLTVRDRKGRVRGEIGSASEGEQAGQDGRSRSAAQTRDSDRLLRARYPSEGDIERERLKAIQPFQERMEREKIPLASAEKLLRELADEADTYKKNNRPMPASLRRDLDEVGQSVEGRKRAIQEQTTEIERLNAKYAATLKRYRQIASAGK
ncbi:DUF4124 domain-containing protein [Noviherbaspirillum massiliense]|uniref:DUF4124 domain-containing protein n=1 Tax=Noviherbaspirillum massiliense TaxID=1465823 RepID=UPI0002FBD8CA|nr:DUF4124 domain-containing protein [Noviherbaspirillum massiliense]